MIKLAGEIEGIQSRADKTWKLTIGTSELSPQTIALIADSQNKASYIVIKSEEYSRSEIDAIEKVSIEYDEKKSPSQRLKHVLYRAWENDAEGYEDSELYYRFKIEKFITHVKSKLP
jgi:chemotaxis regulatin CheY-phosphate phosphatase CheZ